MVHNCLLHSLVLDERIAHQMRTLHRFHMFNCTAFGSTGCRHVLETNTLSSGRLQMLALKAGKTGVILIKYWTVLIFLIANRVTRFSAVAASTVNLLHKARRRRLFHCLLAEEFKLKTCWITLIKAKSPGPIGILKSSWIYDNKTGIREELRDLFASMKKKTCIQRRRRHDQ